MTFDLDRGWDAVRLGDVMTLKRGYDLPQQRREQGDVPIISSSGISGFHSVAKVRGPGVVTGRYGTIGQVFLVEKDFWPLNTALYVQEFKGNDPRFCAALLKTLNFRAYDGKSGVPGVNRNDLHEIEVFRPPVDEQRRIASVMAALEDKIESNRRLTALLEETAATLFRARFVDFVGVEEFENSEIGPIPRGWQLLRFSEAVAVNPTVPIKKAEVTPFIEMAAVPAWATRPSDIGERPYSGGARFEPGDTLMAKITGCIEHGKGAFIDFVPGPASGSTEFLVLRADELLTPEAVFFLSRSERVRSHALANMTGSSGRQRVPVSCFDDLWIALPPQKDEWADEAAFMRRALQQTLALWHESMTLAAIRDALLPKLISGEIRVPEESAA